MDGRNIDVYVDKMLRSDYKMVAKVLTKCSKDYATSIGDEEHEKGILLCNLYLVCVWKETVQLTFCCIVCDAGNEFFKCPDAVNRDLEVDRIPVLAFRPALGAKLRELLHKISLHEIKLCSDAAKEFSKLLKGETGGDLLRLYFNSSPNFDELLEA